MSSVESDLLTNLRATVVRHEMFTSRQTVVVGVSGGPDSTALLCALAQMREDWRLSLVACHVNHGIRGAESDADATYAQELCARLNVECRVEHADVPALQKRRHVSLQQAARDARHALLRRIAGEAGAERIALAHTRDDRAETILLNILRGGGLEGLSGFAPIAFPLVRPLYDVTRAQVERYCDEHGLHPRQDSSNAKTTYRRNRIRLELLPQLRAFYNPHADDALLHLSDLARDDNALLEQMASQKLTELLASANNRDKDKDQNTLALPQSDLNTLPIALRRRVLRQAIARARGHLQDITFETLATFLSACEKQIAYSVELPSTNALTIRLRCDGQQLQIAPRHAPSSRVAWQTPLAMPGRTFVPQAGVTVSVNACSPGDAKSFLMQSLTIEGAAGGEPIPEGGAHAAPDEHGGFFLWARRDITLPLVVRSWLPGDRMRPRGLNGTKKLQDIFTEAGIPTIERGRVPVLVDDAGQGRVLAVGDLRVDAAAIFVARLPDARSALSQWVSGEESGAAKNQELFAIAFKYE
jgi:tRNA(Ile)-lysidine synthase